MDNTTFRIVDVAVEPSELAAALQDRKVKLTRRTDPTGTGEQMLFSLPVGRFKQRWLYRVYPAQRTVVCSGGVTKTFFGHNVWVFDDEAAQLRAVTKIVASAIADLPGLHVPQGFVPAIERAELTRHHTLPQYHDKSIALGLIDGMLMALLPSRYSNEGRTLDDPGTTRIGKTKSDRAFRAYDPASKFVRRPAHIPPDVWQHLCAHVAQVIRLEFMFNKRELKAAGLDTIDAWADDALILRLLASRYERFGLSVAFRDYQAPGFTPAAVRAKHPSFVEPARYFFSGGTRGSPLSSRSGGSARFKRFMLENGYCTDVPCDRHRFLTHGLHDFLRPELAADLPLAIRSDERLFGQWWSNADGSGSGGGGGGANASANK